MSGLSGAPMLSSSFTLHPPHSASPRMKRERDIWREHAMVSPYPAVSWEGQRPKRRRHEGSLTVTVSEDYSYQAPAAASDAYYYQRRCRDLERQLVEERRYYEWRMNQLEARAVPPVHRYPEHVYHPSCQPPLNHYHSHEEDRHYYYYLQQPYHYDHYQRPHPLHHQCAPVYHDKTGYDRPNPESWGHSSHSRSEAVLNGVPLEISFVPGNLYSNVQDDISDDEDEDDDDDDDDDGIYLEDDDNEFEEC